jgi:predicted oxidoreductase
MANYSADVIFAGAGLAGLATAYGLLERGKKVLVLDKDSAGAVGGLARLSFGGICMADTPQQRRTGIKDSPELLHRDWLSYARFGDGQEYDMPRQWARRSTGCMPWAKPLDLAAGECTVTVRWKAPFSVDAY